MLSSFRRSLALFAGLLLVGASGSARAAAPPRPADDRPPARVGQILISGNDRTKQNVILRQVPLYPGGVLTYPDIRQGERNLARLGIFERSPDGSVRPTITVLDNPQDPDSEFKDLLVTVQETATGSLMFGVGVNSDSGLVGSIVLNERNFDVGRWPTSLDDLKSGNAFRGAGQEVRVEVVVGACVPRVRVTFRDPACEEAVAKRVRSWVRGCLKRREPATAPVRSCSPCE